MKKENSSSSSNSMPITKLEEKDEAIVAEEDIKLAQLKIQFHGTRKGEDQTIEAYIQQLKSIANSLAQIGSHVSDQDLVLQLLGGLPYQYLPFQNTITQFPLPTFSHTCSLLSMYETNLSQDQIRRAQLKIQFHGMRKGEDQTIEAYVQQLKDIADGLQEIRCPVSEADLVLQLLAGLPSHEYLPLQNTISTRVPLPTFGEAGYMLQMQEMILLQEAEETARPPSRNYSDLFTFDNITNALNVVGIVGSGFGAVNAVGFGASAGWKLLRAVVRK